MTNTEHTARPEIIDDLDYITGKPVRVTHIMEIGVVQSAYLIDDEITVDVRLSDGTIVGDLVAFGEDLDIQQVSNTKAYAAYRRDVALSARWMVWPSCDECDNGPSQPCRRTCSHIARIFHTR